jgi:hypothetical protein
MSVRALLAGVWRTVTCAYLRKAHTHEDIDGIFGQLALEIGNADFDTIDDIVDILSRRLSSIGLEDLGVYGTITFQCCLHLSSCRAPD